jgi:flagellar L-ring protein precursor FlgH
VFHKTLTACCALLLVACAAPRQAVIVNTPTTARPPAAPGATALPTGGIFQTASYQPLFEDRRPRYVGDILTVQINEKLNASQSADSSAKKDSSVKMAVPTLVGVPGKVFKKINVDASNTNDFSGKGTNNSSNLFTGTITVTVIEVLGNGNLVIGGEKQIGIRQNSETLRFTGVVSPNTIQPGNLVSSTQVADARLDYRGGGNLEEVQIQGWLSRFFSSWSPF